MRSGVPAALDDVLATALSAEPSDRYATAAEFLQALTNVDVRTSASQQAMRRLRARRVRPAFVIALALVAATALVAAVLRWRNPALAGTNAEANADAIASDKSRVAVLPIGVMIPDTALDLVANALTSDLIDELARFPALTVISKNGVMSFRGGAARADSIARVLNVGSIVTGDIRGSGDSVQVTVRLVDGATSAQLSVSWSPDHGATCSPSVRASSIRWRASCATGSAWRSTRSPNAARPAPRPGS